MFKFLKRLRGGKIEAQVQSPDMQGQQTESVAVIQEQTPISDALEVANPAEVNFQQDSEPQSGSEQIPQNQVAEVALAPEVSAAATPVEAIEPAAAVVEVELPARSLGSGIRSLFSADFDLEDLEDILLRADFGVDAAVEITEELKKVANRLGASSDAEYRLLLKDLLIEKLSREDSALNLSSGELPYVILVVGVNGAGKTTTIGKLSRWLRDGDWSVVLGAADTFRAAAVDQLDTWAQRAGAVIVKPEREGQDPASVAYQTVELAIGKDADIAIIDTAGRLQNKRDLMDELGKIRRAVEKQAVITEVAEVTGIVMTKLDGTAKGGIVYSLQQQLDLPGELVGVGEGINDFAFFSPEEFAKGLVAYRQG